MLSSAALIFAAALPCAEAYLSPTEVLGLLFTGGCWSAVWDHRDDCEHILPVYAGIGAFALSVLLCLGHLFRRFWNDRSREARSEEAAAKFAKKKNGNVSPQGHVLERHKAAGGATRCVNCSLRVEYVWGCREEGWNICQRCHTDILISYKMADLKGNPIPLPGGHSGDVEMAAMGYKYPGASAAAAGGGGPGGYAGYAGYAGGGGGYGAAGMPDLEVRVTWEVAKVQGDRLGKWILEEEVARAQTMGIPASSLAEIQDHMMLFHARGKHITSYEDVEKLQEPDFPLIFKFPRKMISQSSKAIKKAEVIEKIQVLVSKRILL